MNCLSFRFVWPALALVLVSMPSQADDKTSTLSLPYSYPFADTAIAEPLSNRTTVIEMFTSLDCLFCPRAERLITDMGTRTSAITLACHTDPEGDDYPLSRGFCTDRQGSYSAALADGLMYTPQFVINGHIDAVGHQFDDVAAGLKKSFADTVTKLAFRTTDEPGIYAVDLPTTDLGKNGNTDLVMITYRKPYTVPKTMRQSQMRPDPLVRVANRFIPVGGWNGTAKTITIPFSPQADEAGFVLFVQKPNGTIIAAGDFVQTL